jgi:F-type H+-transporting ATPase subunit epsilon
MTAFHFELVTPERVLWSGDADAVSMRDDVGDVTFLANHTSLVGALDITVLRILPPAAGEEGGEGSPSGSGLHAAPDREIRAAVHGGFVHVDQNKVVVAAPVAELAEEIDVERARRALAAATSEVEGAEPGEPGEGAAPGQRGAFLDPASPEAARRRAQVRLEAAGVAAEAGVRV